MIKFVLEFMDKLLKSNIDIDIIKKVEMYYYKEEEEENINFEWFIDHDYQLSLTLRENRKIIFNYRHDEDKDYGVMDGLNNIEYIINLLKNLYE